jgi:hypothetical protein
MVLPFKTVLKDDLPKLMVVCLIVTILIAASKTKNKKLWNFTVSRHN